MASRSLGTLTLDLIARIGGFEQGMDKAARSADKNLSAIEKRAYQFGQVLGSALKIGAGAAVAGLGAFAVALKSTINGLDELSKSAQKVGTTTEELSKLAYAGELADVSLDSLTSSLGRLTKAQAEALDTGSETAKVFDALGIAVKDADGNLRSSTSVLGDFAEAFKNLGGSPEAMAAGFKIFGRSFQDLIPLLKDGRTGIQGAADELQRFGGVISSEAGANAEEFNDNLSRLKVQFQAIFSQVAENVLPALVKLSEKLSDAAANGNLAKDAVKLLTGIFDTGVAIANGYRQSVEGITIAMGFLDKASDAAFESAKNFLTFGAAEGGFWSGLGKIKDAASAAADEAERLHKAGQQVAAVDPEAGGIDFSQGAPLTPKERAKQEAAALKALRDALGVTTETTRQATAAKQELTEADKAWIDQEETYAAILEETAAFTTAQVIAEGNLAEQRRQSTADLLADLDAEAALLGKTADEQEVLNNLRWAGVDAASAEGQAIVKRTEELQQQRHIIEDQVAAMDGLRGAWKGFANDLKDGVGGWDALKNAADSFLDTLFQIAIQNIGESLFGPQGSAAGGSTGNIWGQVFGAFFGGARANGGPVHRNGLYEVNERGTELLSVGGRDYLMMGSQSGTVTPAGAFGGSVVVNQTFVNPQMGDIRSESQRQQQAAQQLRTATARNG